MSGQSKRTLAADRKPVAAESPSLHSAGTESSVAVRSDTPASPVLGTAFRWILGILAALHLVIAVVFIVNQVGHREIMSCSDAWHMGYFLQFSEGGHCYYPKNDCWHLTDGYTPLSSEIFGWTIRAFGPDIRAVRAVAALFGVLGMVLVGACVHRLSGSRYFAFVAAGLAAALEPRWFIDAGPNTIHATFSILALWLLLRDPDCSWRTVVLAGLALFASFWSKQLGLAYMTAGVVAVGARDWKKGAALAAGLAILSVAGIAYWSSQEGSQFRYWVFEMNQNQPIVWSRLWDVVFAEILTRKYAILVALSVAGIVARLRSWRDLFRPEWLFLGASGVAGCFANCKYGSGTSQMWVFYMVLIVLGVEAAHRFFRSRGLAAALLVPLLGVQSLAFLEDPRPYMINSEDVARYQRVMGILSTPGKTAYYINAGFMSRLAGQPLYPQAGEDSWVKGRFDRSSLSAERRAYLASAPWDLVIINIPLEDNSYALYEMLDKSYHPLYEIPATEKNSNIYDLRYRKIVFAKGRDHNTPPVFGR